MKYLLVPALCISVTAVAFFAVGYSVSQANTAKKITPQHACLVV